MKGYDITDKLCCNKRKERSYDMLNEQLKKKRQKPNNWTYNILQKDSDQLSTQSTQIPCCDICHEKSCKVDL